MAATSDFVRAKFAAEDPLLTLDGAMFKAHFDRHPFKIIHNLVGHPLLEIPRLIQLARVLSGSILYFKGDQAINQVDPTAGPKSSKRTFLERGLSRPMLSPTEVLAQIEGCGAWMQLRDVGMDPEYAALLSSIIDEFRPVSEPVARGLSAPRADIFVSSPSSTTPFHLDEEHNFLLQIRGSKTLSIADGFNAEVLAPESLREYFAGDGELAPYSEHLEQHSMHVHLSSGEGVHIPPCFPHWVQNGQEVSISLGILWYSDVTARRRHLYRVNAQLERAGLHPSTPGDNHVTDAIKTLPLMVKRRLQRWWQRWQS